MKMKLKNVKKKAWPAIPAAAILLLLLPKMCGDRRLAVKAAHPERMDLVETIPASGIVRPVTEVRITPEVSGEIVEIFVKEGDNVEEGDLLMKIRQDLYLSQVEQATASLGSLRAQYARQRAEEKQARLNHERSLRLLGMDAISKAEYQHDRTAMEIARSSLKAAGFVIRSGEAQLNQAIENLARTTVYAPMGGTVSRVDVERGERVVGTSQMSGTELCRIADFSRMEVAVEVGESDIVRIVPGDTATVEIDAYPRRRFRGFVSQTANSAKNMDLRFEQVTNFAVRIELLPDTVKFLPGMSAAVSIMTRRRNGCLTVPVEAVFTRNREEFIWTVDQRGNARAQRIETGIQQRDRIEILRGVSEDDLVVTSPPDAIARQIEEGCRLRTGR